MKWRNSKERELLSSGGSRESTLPNKSNPNPDLSDLKQEGADQTFDMNSHLDKLLDDDHHHQHMGMGMAPSSSQEEMLEQPGHYSGDPEGIHHQRSPPLPSPSGHMVQDCSDSDPDSDDEEIMVS